MANLKDALAGTNVEAIKDATEKLMGVSQSFSQRLYEQASQAAERTERRVTAAVAAATTAGSRLRRRSGRRRDRRRAVSFSDEAVPAEEVTPEPELSRIGRRDRSGATRAAVAEAATAPGTDQSVEEEASTRLT